MSNRNDYLNALKGLVHAGMSKDAVREAVGTRASPEEYVITIRAIKVPCGRCARTGIWSRSWDVTDPENPRPTSGVPHGICYRCEGKGYQGWSDGLRNAAADMYVH